MTFSDEDIKKYQQLCRDYFNEEINEATAIEEINSLIFMVNLIYRPEIQKHLGEAIELEPKTDTGQPEQLGASSKNNLGDGATHRRNDT